MSDLGFSSTFKDIANKVFTGNVAIVTNANNNVGHYTVIDKNTNIGIILKINNFKLSWSYHFPEVFDISMLPTFSSEMVEFKSSIEEAFYNKISVIIHFDAEKAFPGLQDIIIELKDQKFKNIYGVFINAARDKITINQTNEGYTDIFVAAIRLKHKNSTEKVGLARTILSAIAAYENTF